MNFSLRQLRAFLMVADMQSFTRAAERIHLSQAALSLMIREFEDQIGFKVFDRSTRAVSINAAGLKIYPVVQKTMLDLEDAIREASNISKYQDNLVRVAATSMVSTHVLPHVIAQLKGMFEHLEVELHDVDRSTIDRLVETGEVDVGLCLNSPSHHGFHSVHIGTCGLMLVQPRQAMPGWAAAHQPLPPAPSVASTLASLQGHAIYALPASNSIQRSIDGWLSGLDISLGIKNRFSNIQTILSMVEANGGAALLPTIAQRACQRMDVQTTPLHEEDFQFSFDAIFRRDAKLRPSTEKFIEVFSISMKHMLTGIHK